MQKRAWRGLSRGDVELNDETWADFCAQVKALGIDEMVSIWQSTYDNAWHLDK